MRKLIPILVSAAVLAAAGCGGEDEAASGASELVPASAAVYAEATLKPEGDQKEAVDAILSKFPGGGSAGDKLKGLIDKALRESDAPVDFESDIEPWLGDEVALFAGGMTQEGEFRSVAGLIATEDEDQALAALEKTAEGEIARKRHKDVEYVMDESDQAAAVFDGFLVLGTEAGVRAVIDTKEGGSSLSEDKRYKSALEDAAQDRLGLLFVNSPELARTFRASGTPLPESFRRFFEEPFVATLDADRDGVTFEGSIPESLGRASLFGQGSDLLADLPADSWLAMAQTDFGRLIDFYVDAVGGAFGGRAAVARQFEAATGLDLQEDVIDWMGDFGVFVRGTSVAELDGALIVETDDEAASARFLSALERLARSEADGGVEIAPRGDSGFTATIPGAPQDVHAFQEDGRVVFAFGERAAADAVDAPEKLGDSADFTAKRESLGDYDVSVYVLVQPILDLVDSTEAANDADWQEAKPYLEPLGALVGGTSGDGEDMSSAFKLIVE